MTNVCCGSNAQHPGLSARLRGTVCVCVCTVSIMHLNANQACRTDSTEQHSSQEADRKETNTGAHQVLPPPCSLSFSSASFIFMSVGMAPQIASLHTHTYSQTLKPAAAVYCLHTGRCFLRQHPEKNIDLKCA